MTLVQKLVLAGLLITAGAGLGAWLPPDTTDPCSTPPRTT